MRVWGLDEAQVGDLVWNPVTDGPTVTVKLDVNSMTDISHPLTFPVITTTMCVGAECFSFWCSLSRENEIVPRSNRCHWRLESLSHPDVILVTLGRPCALSRAFFLFIYFQGGVVALPLTHGNWWVSTGAAFCSAFNSETEEAWIHLHPQLTAPRP